MEQKNYTYNTTNADLRLYSYHELRAIFPLLLNFQYILGGEDVGELAISLYFSSRVSRDAHIVAAHVGHAEHISKCLFSNSHCGSSLRARTEVGDCPVFVASRLVEGMFLLLY